MRKYKRWLCLALTLFMILGLVPMEGLAAGPDPGSKEITDVDVSGLVVPVYGAKPDYGITVPEGANYHLATKQELINNHIGPTDINMNGMWWNENCKGMSFSEIFDNETENVYNVDLYIVANDGYKFASEIHTTINGSTELVERKNTDNGYLYIKSNPFTVTKPEPVLQEITDVDVSGLVEPVYGATLNYDVKVPEGANYHLATTQELKDMESPVADLHVNGMWWAENKKLMGTSEIYDDETKDAYTANYTVVPNEGYEFSSNLEITINGSKELYASYQKLDKAGMHSIIVISKNFTVTKPSNPDSNLNPNPEKPVEPEVKPEVTPVPTPQPEVKPEVKPETPVTPVVQGEKVGTKVVDTKTKGKYKVSKSDENEKEVQYTGPVSKKTKTVKIPDTIVIKGITYKVTSIAKDAFKNNKYLQKVIIGKNIKKIDKKAFYGCKKLKSVTIGKNVTVIEDDAFKNCTSLTKVTIPSKVTKINQGAFYGCKKLKKMTIKSKKLKTVGKNAIKNINKKAYIDVPKSKVKAYKKLFKSKTGYKKSMKLK